MHEFDLCAIVPNKCHSPVYVRSFCFSCPVIYISYQESVKSALLYYNEVRDTSSSADNERQGTISEPWKLVESSSLRPYTILWRMFLESLAEAAGLRGPHV